VELFKHNNHRNLKYLSWLRKRACVASQSKAEVAHHIRLGTNGGKGLKPSDYFCVPLTNEYHTTGLWAIHVVGEDTFLRSFRLNKVKIFIIQLQDYLKEKYKVIPYLEGLEDLRAIEFLINEIELRREDDQPLKKVKIKRPKTEFYEKSKELKRSFDKKMRENLKETQNKITTEQKPFKISPPKQSETEFYQIAKEAKKKIAKDFRTKMKGLMPKQKTPKASESEFYQKAKEAKRALDKKFRDKLKEQSRS